VGIVEPLDPHDDVWGQDLSGFEIGDLDADAIVLPLIIAPASMRSNYPEAPIFWHEVSWRITLNHHLVSVDQAEPLHSALINFQTQSATRRAATSTGLVQILADYLARLSRVRMTFFLLTAQTLFFVLYTLTTFTSFMVDRSRVELATLSARGASAWQITRLFGLENLILALPAGVLLGPGLAQGATWLWGQSAGEAVPSALPREAWLLSGVGCCREWSLAWAGWRWSCPSFWRRGATDSDGSRRAPAPRSFRRYKSATWTYICWPLAGCCIGN